LHVDAKNISIKNLFLKNLGIWFVMLFAGKANAIWWCCNGTRQ